jgi:hypothetical protein
MPCRNPDCSAPLKTSFVSSGHSCLVFSFDIVRRLKFQALTASDRFIYAAFELWCHPTDSAASEATPHL